MIVMGAVFLSTLLVLYLISTLAGSPARCMGLDATFVKVNLALMVTAGCSGSRFVGAAPLSPLLWALVLLALIDVLWAGYLGRREQAQRRKNG